MDRKYHISLYILGAITLVLVFATGYLANDLVRLRTGDFPIFNQAMELIRDHGYSEFPPSQSIEYGMIRGMISAYGDPYTSFVEPARHELETDDLHGSFGGIGVRSVRQPDGSLLLYPFQESPAILAGLKDADELLTVGDLVVNPETSIEEVFAALRGPVGESVNLMIRRLPGPKEIHFSIRRESVPLPSVTWHISSLDPRVGVLEINILAASTKDEVISAVEDLKSNGATHFVMDLRDNSGGLLDAGIETARLFMGEGLIIEQQFRGEAVKTYSVDEPGPFSDIPLIVVINQNTASAAEILAGAIQNSGRAQLLGHPSYGKDSIQLVFNLTDGSSIHVTAARWWLPNAIRPLSEGGLEPDFLIGPTESEPDLVIQEAVRNILTD